MTELFWSGSYSSDLDGIGDGIGALRRQGDGSLRFLGTVAPFASPSFLIQHPLRDDLMYALLEGSTRIQALRRTDELSFELLGSQRASGELPCHGSITPDGLTLFTASYGNGSLASSPLAAGGEVGPLGAVLTFSGSGPHPDQANARGHTALVIDDSTLVNLDLGTDEVRLFAVGPGAELRQLDSLRLPPGSGPRDLLVHRSGLLLVLTELSNEIFVIDCSSESSELSIVSSASLADGESLAGSHASGISQSVDGGHVYASTRGADCIVTFAVRDDGRRLERVTAVSTGGSSPRHHIVDGHFLYACNQLSNTITSFSLNSRTGVPEAIGAPEPVPSPTFLLRATTF